MRLSQHQSQLASATSNALVFPEELWDIIAACTDQNALKTLRLCCKTFSRIATPHLFRAISFHYDHPKSRIRNILWHSHIQEYVRTLSMRRCDVAQHIRDSAGAVRNPFVNLTSVDTKIYYDSSNTRASLSALWIFLLAAEKLEILRVEDRQFLDLLEPFRITKSFPRESCWKKLHTVTLIASMSGTSFLALLSTLASTLRSLTLINCMLPIPGDTWPRVLDQARSMISLESVALDNLEDHLDTYLPFRDSECDIIASFQQSVFDYMIKNTDICPEWDATEVLKIHMNFAGTPRPEGHGMHCLQKMGYSQKYEDLLEQMANH
ncbi:hypothetical protein B0J12DRAFT_346550 [Macrophomina phaseolina]|uniref:F-box domain-containing protein n=1 Tax=Macrophomina phaseolina TaxID=35725 RepID=A0ABQ8GMK0_9PEZI|nr:hypothetical protein B0J12DRAFT_346550 [Macrophomina phaseolina]